MPVFEQEFEVGAPIEAVWECVSDPERLGRCIPGCIELRAEDDRTWRMRLTMRLGFLSTTQDVTLTIEEANAPHRLRLVGRGADVGLGGRAEVATLLALGRIGRGRTRVRYRSEVRVIGPFGAIGDVVASIRAGQVASEFGTRLRAAVERSA